MNKCENGKLGGGGRRMSEEGEKENMMPGRGRKGVHQNLDLGMSIVR